MAVQVMLRLIYVICIFKLVAAFSCNNNGDQKLSFCSEYNSYGCCSIDEDMQLSSVFSSLGFLSSDANIVKPCEDVFKALLCSRCNPNTHLLLRNITSPASASLPSKICATSCDRVFHQCKEALSFAKVPTQNGSKVADLFSSLEAFSGKFCDMHSAEGVCYTGKEFISTNEEEERRPGSRILASPASALCFERIHNGAILNMVGHPASASYALMADKGGLIQLVELPPVGTSRKVRIVSTWLNLTPRVININERGLLGITFHYKFLTNGKFYVSYICDGNKYRDCRGPCACNSRIGCSLGAYGASCYMNTVIAEYRVPNPRDVRSRPSARESKRLFTYARPFANHNGGDIFFGKDGYLYITSGDGGNQGDPFNAAQKGRTLLGKILRINVDKNEGRRNYSIPGSNPFRTTKNVFPEIFALGLRNPWRCSVDSRNGNIFCGDVGQFKVEEVDAIMSGYNYGWSKYEGTSTHKGGIKLTLGKKVQGPLFQYAHFGVNIPGIPQGGNSVIGGVLYRAPRNKCLQGKYLYNDLLGNFWAGTVYPGAGKTPFTNLVGTKCAPNSPYGCSVSSGRVNFGAAWSWGSDISRNAYVLSTSGVYRLTDLSRCRITC